MDFTNKVILVVGASSGIGKNVAIQLAQQGAQLAITARRQNKLNEVKTSIESFNGKCFALTTDALIEHSAETAIEKIVAHYGRIDGVLLNAGGAPALDMRSMTASDVNYYMRCNYDVTVNYLFPILEQMKTQKSGFIAHTNSLAGFLGIPLQGPYSAAKSATRILLDTCRLEFFEYGIKFFNVYPGFVATEATANDGMPAPLEISADSAAKYIIYALSKEKSDYFFPFYMRWLIRFSRMLPKYIVNKILRTEVPSLK